MKKNYAPMLIIGNSQKSNTTSHRLTVRRRAYEYEHQYGLTVIGKAISNNKELYDLHSSLYIKNNSLKKICK